MTKCPACGADGGMPARFCTECGTPMDVPALQPAVVEAPRSARKRGKRKRLNQTLAIHPEESKPGAAGPGAAGPGAAGNGHPQEPPTLVAQKAVRAPAPSPAPEPAPSPAPEPEPPPAGLEPVSESPPLEPDVPSASGWGVASVAPDLVAPDLVAPDLVAPDLVAPDSAAEGQGAQPQEPPVSLEPPGPSEAPLSEGWSVPSSPDVSASPALDIAPLSGMIDDLEQTFDNILDDPGRVSQEPQQSDVEEAQMLFRYITAAYVAPVRDFLVELEMSELDKSWLAICMPASRSFSDAAHQVQLPTLAEVLDAVHQALVEAEAAPGNLITGSHREKLLERGKKLQEELPEAFSLSAERAGREPIVVSTVLARVPGVRKLQLDKLYAAGLTTLEAYYLALPDELAAATGLDFQLSTLIVDGFQEYKRGAQAGPADAERSADLRQLGQYAERLAEIGGAYDDRSSGAVRRREIRKEKKKVTLEVNLLLARLGEVKLVKQLDKLPTARVAEELVKFIAERAAS